MSIPTNSMQAFNQFTIEHKDLFYKYLFIQLKIAIGKNRSVIEFFRLGNTQYIFKLDSQYYEDSIQQMQNYFIEHENYDMASKCIALLDKHKVNMVIKSSR